MTSLLAKVWRLQCPRRDTRQVCRLPSCGICACRHTPCGMRYRLLLVSRGRSNLLVHRHRLTLQPRQATRAMRLVVSKSRYDRQPRWPALVRKERMSTTADDSARALHVRNFSFSPVTAHLPRRGRSWRRSRLIMRSRRERREFIRPVDRREGARLSLRQRCKTTNRLETAHHSERKRSRAERLSARPQMTAIVNLK